MLLTVDPAPDSQTATSFTFVVPGDQLWIVRSVVATVSTDTGGQPTRGYMLQVTDGTNVVAQSGNTDGGTEPATGTLTWANAPGAESSAGAVFSAIAPFPNLTLKPGYNIIGTIVNSVGADAWISALVWYDFSYTHP